MFVSCHMPKKVRVGRSDFFIFLFICFAKRDFVDWNRDSTGIVCLFRILSMIRVPSLEVRPVYHRIYYGDLVPQ